MRKTLLLLLFCVHSFGSEILFREPFRDSLAPGWNWIREESAAWRLKEGALEIRIQPGNMWGPENSGKNVLVRALPTAKRPVVVSMKVENQPTAQYEQVDLVCYFDDSNMIKIGEELVDGQLSIVMGREQGDKTRTIAIIPLAKARVELKLRIDAEEVTGQFRPDGESEWKTAGKCDLPAKGEPKIAIQCYQGPRDQDHWAKIENFVITSNEEK